ncbi:hypothetical protein [Streptosporangium sp. NPDC051022]|uniref:hypothetical protein n=1 Tax=Streptosporangium sp. NPDC051022 TaxID=3155752 RepID=UPI0034447965
MTSLHYVDVSDGTVFDTITLVDGELRFETGAARDVIASVRRFSPGDSDESLFSSLVESGWSNGYAALHQAATS